MDLFEGHRGPLRFRFSSFSPKDSPSNFPVSPILESTPQHVVEGTLPKTNSSPLTMGGWENDPFRLGQKAYLQVLVIYPFQDFVCWFLLGGLEGDLRSDFSGSCWRNQISIPRGVLGPPPAKARFPAAAAMLRCDVFHTTAVKNVPTKNQRQRGQRNDGNDFKRDICAKVIVVQMEIDSHLAKVCWLFIYLWCVDCCLLTA